MIQVTFIAADGQQRTVEAREGQSLMEAAKANDVEGIDADCGGACACATCHVMVAAEWQDQLAEIAAEENTMLEFSLEQRSPRSRLSCQIPLTAELDGLVVHLPESQGY